MANHFAYSHHHNIDHANAKVTNFKDIRINALCEQITQLQHEKDELITCAQDVQDIWEKFQVIYNKIAGYYGDIQGFKDYVNNSICHDLNIDYMGLALEDLPCDEALSFINLPKHGINRMLSGNTHNHYLGRVRAEMRDYILNDTIKSVALIRINIKPYNGLALYGSSNIDGYNANQDTALLQQFSQFIGTSFSHILRYEFAR